MVGAGPVGEDGREAGAQARFLTPMAAMVADEVPGANLMARPHDWWVEPKLDGVRCLAVRNDRMLTLFSRNELPLNARFPSLAAAAGRLPA
ncbi:MAG TPA: hypothetical protein VME46_07025, partial [Acidimicrobiales bacterium]|nr:hypothetical protein [Acidimicrobiales bacterium]